MALLLLLLLAQAQPTIDGSIATDETEYIELAEWTQGDTGFGDHGIVKLFAQQDGTNLYVSVLGEAQNGNAILLYMDVASQDGIGAGETIPESNDGFSPFGGGDRFEGFTTLRLTSAFAWAWSPAKAMRL